MTKKSAARLVKDVAAEGSMKHRIPHDLMLKAKDSRQAMRLAAARAQPYLAAAQAAEADYNAAIAEGIAAAGVHLDEKAVLCFQCGLIRVNEPVGPKGETRPCPDCYPQPAPIAGMAAQ